MGELLICNEPIAALPYYIEDISWNVYSLEELCYYIEHNAYLLDKDFMNEELCTWIDKEIKNIKLAQNLRDIMQTNGRLSDFVQAILLECGYCPRNTIQEIVGIIHEMEEKTDFECSKVRADRLMEKGKYLSSIYEYRNLLESSETLEQSKELIGNIWHNLGAAYARLFLFQEAANCYEKAFSYNKNIRSIKECLMAYLCLCDEDGFTQIVKKYHISFDVQQGLRNEISLASQTKTIMEFENKLESIVLLNTKGKKKEYKKAVSDTIFKWKEEYRYSCII